VTRDLARAMVMTIGLYLVYGAHLRPLWCWLPIGWMGANTTSPPPLRHPRIRLSTLGESGKSSWKGRRRLLRRDLAAPSASQ